MGRPVRHAAPVSGGTVFVTVGTTKFDALIAAVDDPRVADALVARGYGKLVMQVGSGSYTPRHVCPPGEREHSLPNGLRVEWFEFAPGLGSYMAEAALIISHAGSGSLFEALALRRPLLAVPNGLLMHNHQAELAAQLANMNHLVASMPDQLLPTLLSMELGALEPYEPGNAAPLVAHLDTVMGFV